MTETNWASWFAGMIFGEPLLDEWVVLDGAAFWQQIRQAAADRGRKKGVWRG